jgi:peptidoglycan/LPS O-acetylase OafA/YrhL
MNGVNLSGPSSRVAARVGPLHGFRPDVQALRGLAVLLVVLYHAGGVVPAGYIGVDVFFVISGFVVGRLLVGEFAVSGCFDWRRFYARRIKRLLPGLALMLSVVILHSPLLAAISTQETTTSTGIAASLFSANSYLLNAGGDYFGPKAELNPLLHTWSLSIEEQFYILFPALVAVALLRALTRFDRIVVVRLIVGLVGMASFAFCVAASSRESVLGFDGERVAFYMPFTRAWEFTAGVALTLLPERWIENVRQAKRSSTLGLIAPLGVAGVVVSAFTFDSVSPFPGYAVLLPVGGTALAIFGGGLRPIRMATDRHTADRIGTSGPLQRLGDISYSWYLWHWPIIVFVAASGSDRTWVLLLAAAASLVPAWLSFTFVETRFRRQGRRAATSRVARIAGVTVLVPVVLGIGVSQSALADRRLPNETIYRELNRWHVDVTNDCGYKS